MKAFRSFQIDPEKCHQELDDFAKLLCKQELEERKHILPFFEKHEHLAALIGSFNTLNSRYDKLAHELTLAGDFMCDLVTGDSQSCAYCFVEFEDATKNSIFIKTNRARSVWSSRLEKGFGQLLDWIWKVDEQRAAITFRHLFGSENPNCVNLLVIGRSCYLDNKNDWHRFYWRRDNVSVDNKPIICMTYDDLFDALKGKLSLTRAVFAKTTALQEVKYGG